jgi:hypothetical protein
VLKVTAIYVRVRFAHPCALEDRLRVRGNQLRHGFDLQCGKYHLLPTVESSSADVELGGDGFIRQAGDHAIEHGPGLFGKLRESSAEFRSTTGIGLSSAGQFNGAANDVDEFRSFKRLLKETRGTVLHEADRGLDVGKGSDDDDRHRRLLVPKAIEEFAARNAGHAEIADHAEAILGLRAIKKLAGRGKSAGLEAGFGKDLYREGGHIRIVVDDTDRCWLHKRPRFLST